jgi:hypothetical protein
MGTGIKILQCPQCGSTDKTDLKRAVFQCNNCKTVYYLEDEAPELEVQHNAVEIPSPLKKKRTTIMVSIAFVCIMFLVALFYFGPTHSDGTATTAADTTWTKEKEDQYMGGKLSTHYFVQPVTQKPIILNLEWRTYKDQKVGPTKETLYLIFYDPLEKKVISEAQLGESKGFTQKIELRTFSNQRTYLISSTDIYELDGEAFTVKPVAKELFADLAQAQNGLASLKFTEDGDGLEIVTSEEQLLYYFPLIKKTYTPKAYEKASHGFNTLLPGAKERTYHHFTERKNEYSNFKLQLLKITYLDNGAGPKTFQKFFVWSNTWVMGRGYQVCLVIPDLKEYRRITSYKDLTPGRNYYQPKVVYEDASTLLIRFRASADKTSPYRLQRLDRSNGEVIWTVPLANGEAIDRLYRYKNGYYAFVNQGVELFDLDGTSIDRFKN